MYSRTFLSLLLFLFLLPTLSAQEWNTYRGDNTRTGLVNTSPITGTPVVLWNYTFTSGSLTTSPAISGGLLFIGDSGNGKFYAFNISNRSVTWEYVFASALYSNPAVIPQNAVYFGTEAGNIYALAVEDGTLLWFKPTGSAVQSSPLLIGADDLYIGSANGQFYYLDSTTGNENNAVGEGQIRSPASDGVNGVVFGSDNNRVVLQAYDLSGSVFIHNAPDVVRNSVVTRATDPKFIYSSANVVRALNSDGVQAWDFSISDSNVSSELFLTPNYVIFGHQNGYVYGLDVNDGSQLWNVSLGTSLPRDAVGSSQDTSVFFLVTNDSLLFGIDPATGDLLWNITIGPNPITDASLAYAEGVLYIGDDDGVLYAIGDAVVDTTAPTVTFLSPLLDASITDTTPTIQFAVNDTGLGINSSTITLTVDQTMQYVNGVNITCVPNTMNMSNTTCTATLSALALGVHNLTVNATDISSNLNSSTSNFTLISSDTTSGGGSGTETDAPLFSVSSETEKTVSVSQGDYVRFTHGGSSHKITVDSYDLERDTVTLTIRSEPQTFTVSEGIPLDVDLDSDGTYDITVVFNGVVRSQVSLTVSSYTEPEVEPSLNVSSQTLSQEPEPFVFDPLNETSQEVAQVSEVPPQASSSQASDRSDQDMNDTLYPYSSFVMDDSAVVSQPFSSTSWLSIVVGAIVILGICSWFVFRFYRKSAQSPKS